MSTASYNLADASVRSHSRLGTTLPKQTRFDIGSGDSVMHFNRSTHHKNLGIETAQNSFMRGSWVGRQGQSIYSSPNASVMMNVRKASLA